MNDSHQRRQGILELHAAIFLVGLTGLFGKMDLSPATIVFGRAAFAAAALGLVMLGMQSQTGSPWKRPSKWTAVSGLLLATHWVAFFQAIQVSTVAVGLLTFSSFPLFVTLLEPWFFQERRRWLDLLTAALVMAGVALIVPSFDFRNNVTQGAFWGVLSGFVYALLCILNRRLLMNQTALMLTWGQNLVAGLVLLPLVLWESTMPSPRDVLLLAVLGVVCTALAHYLFIRGLSFVRAQLASVVTALESVYAILFAALLLGEVPGLRTLSGGAVILGAVVVATLGRNSEK
ncbi:MAG: EamA family transporter [Pirellulales bacterium]|nr:EamA family transporter [Pirellulales bacterium]